VTSKPYFKITVLLNVK